MRYVDDLNMGAKPVKPGVRLVDGKLSILDEVAEEDRQLPADLRTDIQSCGKYYFPHDSAFSTSKKNLKFKLWFGLEQFLKLFQLGGL